jgi:hydrogenase maturation protease
MGADRGTIRLLVCGSPDRADDGVALRAVARLAPRVGDEGPIHLDVRRCGQLDVEQLLDVPAGTPVLIVDAAAGVPAGEVVTLNGDRLLARPRAAAPRSSHALPVDQVLGLARILADQPLDVTFVGVGGADFGLGGELSPAVRRALPEYVSAIEAAIEAAAVRSGSCALTS